MGEQDNPREGWDAWNAQITWESDTCPPRS
jgi:hypothetical protein